jgi:hypothetical protein
VFDFAPGDWQWRRPKVGGSTVASGDTRGSAHTNPTRQRVSPLLAAVRENPRWRVGLVSTRARGRVAPFVNFVTSASGTIAWLLCRLGLWTSARQVKQPRFLATLVEMQSFGPKSPLAPTLSANGEAREMEIATSQLNSITRRAEFAHKTRS